MKIIPHIILQHAENLEFNWLLRNSAVNEPHYSLNDLAKLDDRLEADIDGLRIAGEEGWQICKEELAWEEPGEFFAAAVLAFESGNEDRIREVIETGSEDPELARGIISALGWMKYSEIQKYIQNFLDSESPDLRRIGIAASAIHRKDPGKYIADAISSDDLLLKARALKAAGELGRKDLLPFISTMVNNEDDNCRFQATWSASLLGNVDAVSSLKTFGVSESPFNEAAVKLTMRLVNASDSLVRQKELARNPDTLRLALIGAGAIGDPVLIPWLIELMAVPEHARVAGEAFTMITGVDIVDDKLEGEWPEGFEAGPTEEPEDEDVEMDADEDLPWPEPNLISEWWGKSKNNFRSGTRYLCDKPISEEQCQHVLRHGYQRQRAAAALELAMMKLGQPLFEVRAPGFRQQKILGLK